MDNTITELVFLLDRSGSMHGLESDTIGGFNALIEKQKAVPGGCFVTTILFDNVSERLHDRLPLDQVPLMTERDYIPRGSTALLDAVGETIQHISDIHKYARPEDVPEHTLFVITTDGMENASRRFLLWQIKDLIREKQNKYGWEFLFLGANMDAIKTAGSLGITAERAANYCADGAGTRAVYDVVSKAACSIRCSEPLSPDWSKPLEKERSKPETEE